MRPACLVTAVRTAYGAVYRVRAVVVASGTFGFGREYGQFYDLGQLGGICAKGLTLHRREGNPGPRIAETPMGILNSVGLQNPGVEAVIRKPSGGRAMKSVWLM